MQIGGYIVFPASIHTGWPKCDYRAVVIATGDNIVIIIGFLTLSFEADLVSLSKAAVLFPMF